MLEISVKPSSAGVFLVIDDIVYLKPLTALELASMSGEFAKAAKEREWHDRCQRAADEGAFDVV